jgi:hypothetical protein
MEIAWWWNAGQRDFSRHPHDNWSRDGDATAAMPRLVISIAYWARAKKISSHMSSAKDQNRLKLSGDVWLIDWCNEYRFHIPIMVSLFHTHNISQFIYASIYLLFSPARSLPSGKSLVSLTRQNVFDAPADGHGRAEESGWLIGLYHILSAGSQDVWRDAPPTSTNNMTGVWNWWIHLPLVP